MHGSNGQYESEARVDEIKKKQPKANNSHLECYYTLFVCVSLIFYYVFFFYVFVFLVLFIYFHLELLRIKFCVFMVECIIFGLNVGLQKVATLFATMVSVVNPRTVEKYHFLHIFFCLFQLHYGILEGQTLETKKEE